MEFNGASPRERLKPTEEEKGQAGRPRGVGTAGLLPVGLHFFGFFFCELFDASQAYVLLNIYVVVKEVFHKKMFLVKGGYPVRFAMFLV